jgi:pyruvate formate lyase activating enzyme
MTFTSHQNKGLVFNIQKFSLHDGEGIRTLVFLKGCPLSCTWCSNPEGQSFLPELAYNVEKCIGTAECTMCRDVCTKHALEEDENQKIKVLRNHCDNCGKCADACPSKALEMTGRVMSVDDVIKAVEEDGRFYVRSGGGITLSGGEPLSQPDFSYEILKTAKRRGLNTAMETSGLCSWEAFDSAVSYVDQLFFDIKSMDPLKHKDVTGVENEPILENYKKLCRVFPDLNITVRTPIIPGVNDSVSDIQAIRQFIKSTGKPSNYELLPYHQFGESKYHKLGKPYPMRGVKPPDEETMKRLKNTAT